MTAGRLKIWNDAAGEWEYPPGGNGGSAGPTAVSVPLTSAEILACNNTPIELVPSPGPGKALVVSAPFIQVIGQTVGYTIAANAGVFAAPVFALWAEFTAPLAFAGDAFSAATSNPGPFDAVNVEDLPLTFAATVADPTNGDGDAIVSFVYHVVDVA